MKRVQNEILCGKLLCAKNRSASNQNCLLINNYERSYEPFECDCDGATEKLLARRLCIGGVTDGC